jgi:putative sigma-54 modulation protein
MNLHYTGGNGELTAAQLAKLEKRFLKLGKMIDGKGEKEAHVILNPDKLKKKAEITVNFQHHSLVSVAKGPAYLPALTEALDKLEKQVIKLREKKRESVRVGVKLVETVAREAAKEAAKKAPPIKTGPKVHAAKVSKKPMSVDEAVLVAIRKSVPYVAFRDAETEGISVVIRRADGDFDFFQA